MRFDFARAEARVRLALTRRLPLARRGHLHAHVARSSSRSSDSRVHVPMRERVRRQRRHLDAEIDAVDERPRDAAAIAGDSVRRAMAAAARMAEPAAGAGIHRGDELELGGKRALPRRARDVDHAGLERLAQHFEHAAIPFGQLVEEQHAVMRERDLAGPRIAAAADERHGARRVMRRAKRAHAPARRREAAGERRDRRDVRAPRLRTAAAAARAGAARASTCRCPAGRSSAGCARRLRRWRARASRAPGRARRRDRRPRARRRRRRRDARARQRLAAGQVRAHREQRSTRG